VSVTVRYVPGLDRYIEQYRATQPAGAIGAIAPPDRRRMLVLTAAFTPMVAIAALPVTALVGVVASLVANVTARWVGAVVLVPAVVGLGYLTARWAAKYDDVPATRGWRRWLPLAATVVVVGLCLAEIVSGSHAPDPVILLWFASTVWVFAFLPLAAGVWGPTRRALWAVGPAVAFAAIMFIWTQGFFTLRFARAVPDLDDLAQQVAKGGHVADGTHAGGFVVHDVNLGRLGKTAGCDVELWITGWHEDDTRYVAHCVDHPREDFADFGHLAGDWWELKDKTQPADL
jgi:hypothetical protein